LSVELEPDEDVRWHWTHFADGRSMVTGYTIVKATRQDALELLNSLAGSGL
jgi:hypothetical protein